MSVIIPGSYDPVTLGHLDVIKRASEMYDEVYAVIFTNPDKNYTFSLEERIKMLIIATDELDNVIVSSSDGLVVDYMREHEIEKIVKGYRNEKDLEYERIQAEWNFNRGGFETELLKADESLSDVSSTKVREILSRGLDASLLLPRCVLEYLKRTGHFSDKH